MSEMGLVCSAITVDYPEFTLSVDLSIAKGELVSLIGPSGCGKSTTLQLISGLIPCQKGSIFLNGKDISHTPVWQRRIGMVFQEYALFPHLNVEQNIAYSLKLKRIGKEHRKAKVEHLLELVGLEGFGKRKVDQLSGGERQRVAIARALAAEVQLLLLDEPLSALDAKLRKHMRQQIRLIHEKTGITTLYVTHDQEEAMALSDRIAVMQEGSIVQLATAEVIYNQPATPFVAHFMGEGTMMPTSLAAPLLQKAAAHHLQKLQEAEHLFFRPEMVNVGGIEYLPHLSFTKARLLYAQYQGGRYILTCLWHNQQILAYSRNVPKEETIILTVRFADLVLY